MTASGGNLIGSEVKRNKQSPQCGVAPIELAERRKMSDQELCRAAYIEMQLVKKNGTWRITLSKASTY